MNLEVAEMDVRDQLDGEAVQCVVDAKESTKRLIKMVNSMLDVSRLESSEMPLNLGTVDLSELVLAALATVGNRSSRVSVKKEEPGQVTAASCDREVIQRVIENLVSNALDYSPEKEPVSVDIRRRNGRVRMSVSDSGPGIPEDCREQIFNKFGQVGTIQKARKASTGIGLNFCKLAVEAHSGSIGVESQVGKGSTFWFELPVS
jgi:signal transduction histidine kinase